MKDALTETSEEAAIRAVIDTEIAAFFARDFETWADCYLHSPRCRSVMMSHEFGLDVREGWQAHAESVRLHFEGDAPEPAEWSKTIEQIEINGDTCWLVCRARNTSNECMMHEAFETWVLERHDGQWKAVLVTVLAERSFAARDSAIAVDAEGRVVGLSARAAARLDAHPALALRQGKLRATDPAVDAALQSAIDRAGRLHGYFEQAAFAQEQGQRFAYPLVIERPGENGHEVLLLTVQDRLTYLDFGAAATATRVDVGAMIFGLSEAQTRVAQAITEGLNLTEAAQRLGISPSTAKTHLQRTFEKTGTSSQVGLVRALLSVG